MSDFQATISANEKGKQNSQNAVRLDYQDGQSTEKALSGAPLNMGNLRKSDAMNGGQKGSHLEKPISINDVYKMTGNVPSSDG